MSQFNTALQPFIRKPEIQEDGIQPITSAAMDYDFCRERIIYRLVHAKRNREILEDSPHIPIFDLAVTFYVLVSKKKDEIGSIRITNAWMDAWEVDTTTLLQQAQENTPRIFPAKCCPLRSMLESLIFRTGEPEENLSASPVQEIYVLTNRCGINGASVWLYPGFFSRIAVRCGDFYILPSSIHELLAVPTSMGMSQEEMEAMVRQVNRECVEEDEFLSDHIYLYEKKKDRVHILG